MRVFSPEELIEASYTFKICRHDLYWSLNPDVKYDCILCIVPGILIKNMTSLFSCTVILDIKYDGIIFIVPLS